MHENTWFGIISCESPRGVSASTGMGCPGCERAAVVAAAAPAAAAGAAVGRRWTLRTYNRGGCFRMDICASAAWRHATLQASRPPVPAIRECIVTSGLEGLDASFSRIRQRKFMNTSIPGFSPNNFCYSPNDRECMKTNDLE